jgi:hypothetical protein
VFSTLPVSVIKHCITKADARPLDISEMFVKVTTSKCFPVCRRDGCDQGRACSPPYGFGEVRVAALALLIFTALSGWRSCGVVITKFSDHVVTFRSSPTVLADTPVPTSTKKVRHQKRQPVSLTLVILLGPIISCAVMIV